MAKHESTEDKIFQKFKRKIALEPEQVKWSTLLALVFSWGVICGAAPRGGPVTAAAGVEGRCLLGCSCPGC